MNADRVQHQDELEAELERTLTRKAAAEWIEIIAGEGGVPAGPVYEVEEALHDPQIDAVGTVSQIEHPELGTVPSSNPR